MCVRYDLTANLIQNQPKMGRRFENNENEVHLCALNKTT
jgi:hypothetical protein